jgi:hypothetical protein
MTAVPIRSTIANSLVISSRLFRRPVLVLAGGLLVTAFAVNAVTIAGQGGLGIDAAFYRSVGQRFLDGGPLYLPHQLAGPYDVGLEVDNLYPPTALALFVPLAVLPVALWWLIPLAVTGYALWRWKPAWWGVAGMLVLLTWPRAHAAFLFENSDMWAMAAVAGGLTWGWPALFLTIKPVFAPLALIGFRHRYWWAGVAAMGALAVVTAPLWRDYVVAMTNLRIGSDYSLASLPLLMVPVVGWAASTRMMPNDQVNLIQSNTASTVPAAAPSPMNSPTFATVRLGVTAVMVPKTNQMKPSRDMEAVTLALEVTSSLR